MRKINGKYPKIEREKVKINWIKRVKNVWGVGNKSVKLTLLKRNA